MNNINNMDNSGANFLLSIELNLTLWTGKKVDRIVLLKGHNCQDILHLHLHLRLHYFYFN